MEIITIPISEIHAAAYNPRKDLQPEDATYQALQNSMEKFGYAEPVIWNRRTKNLVGGHQRFKILKAQGLQEIQVSVVDLSLDEEKAFNIALNKIDGQWDDDKLRDLLKEIDNTDVDVLLTGFEVEELEGLLAEINDDTFDDFFVDPVEENAPEGEHKESSDADEPAASRSKEQARQMTVCPFCGREHEV